MELTFVEESEVKAGPGRREQYPWSEAIAIVEANPGKWARLPFTVTNASSAYHQAKKRKGLEVVCKQSESSKPDAKDWIVFLRFTPQG